MFVFKSVYRQKSSSSFVIASWLNHDAPLIVLRLWKKEWSYAQGRFHPDRLYREAGKRRDIRSHRREAREEGKYIQSEGYLQAGSNFRRRRIRAAWPGQ